MPHITMTYTRYAALRYSWTCKNSWKCCIEESFHLCHFIENDSNIIHQSCRFTLSCDCDLLKILNGFHNHLSLGLYSPYFQEFYDVFNCLFQICGYLSLPSKTNVLKSTKSINQWSMLIDLRIALIHSAVLENHFDLFGLTSICHEGKNCSVAIGCGNLKSGIWTEHIISQRVFTNRSHTNLSYI